ncbi:ABC transporter substrate-binding protein [Croceivirga thetidis]|uniref:ABC transporter substrate-binding protein n=1 Tax=Croceivirga thetidis TaxID=2721623 RepID=A0ABX1GSN9_9FLAO|nr:ABC transporter substrate-binding protein [Croceivirga thetidis]NKI32629.1 ABC transporter substrate-binding protein [Croceivirga thetidis]
MPKNIIPVFAFLFILLGCKREVSKNEQENPSDTYTIEFAKGFSVKQFDSYTVIEVLEPWPNSDKTLKYLVVEKEKLAALSFPKDAYDAIVTTPISKLVVTSTTHIPALESLESLDKLVGFPNTQYISSLPARKGIKEGRIKDLGQNENLNTEMTLALQPDLVVGFAITNENQSYDVLKRANIPVVFNGDWVERTPLGKAEWIKFFGVLLNKEKEASELFETIKSDYQNAKSLASQATSKPKILSGALYKDVWYAPAGGSWAARFLKDANTEYLYESSEGAGSLSLSLETVLENSDEAEIWISPSQFTSYNEMENSNEHYTQFRPFKNKTIFTFAATKGPTGGLLYYELAPQRPDLVLKDLVKITHPELLPDYSPFFFTPLQ